MGLRAWETNLVYRSDTDVALEGSRDEEGRGKLEGPTLCSSKLREELVSFVLSLARGESMGRRD